MAGEGTKVFVFSGGGSGEDHAVGFAGSEKFGVSENLALGLLVGRDKAIGAILRLGRREGKLDEVFAGFQNDDIVAHGLLRKGASVLEGDLDDLSFGDFERLLVKLHGVISGDFQSDIRSLLGGFFFLRLSEAERADEKGEGGGKAE